MGPDKVGAAGMRGGGKDQVNRRTGEHEQENTPVVRSEEKVEQENIYSLLTIFYLPLLTCSTIPMLTCSAPGRIEK